MTRREEGLKKAIVDRICSDSRVDARDIGVYVSGGHVVLRGIVPSDLARDSAQADALQVAGVADVDNQLEVQQPTAEAASTDREIESQVRAALAESPSTGEGSLGVTFHDGIATLEGTVDGLWRKLQAERVAAEQAGVSSVRNLIEVLPSELASDSMTARAIRESLERIDSIHIQTVDVNVQDGVVFLSGSVSSESARQAAHNAALHMPGVRDLCDNLVVETRNRLASRPPVATRGRRPPRLAGRWVPRTTFCCCSIAEEATPPIRTSSSISGQVPCRILIEGISDQERGVSQLQTIPWHERRLCNASSVEVGFGLVSSSWSWHPLAAQAPTFPRYNPGSGGPVARGRQTLAQNMRWTRERVPNPCARISR